MTFKAFKYRIYPNRLQQQAIRQTCGCVRYIYNWGLDLKNKQYAQNGKSENCIALTNRITELKRQEETSWLKNVPSQALQMSVRTLDNAYTRFFKKQAKFPKFKSKHNLVQAFSLPQGIRIENNKVFIPKVGWIRFANSQEFTGKIGTSTVSIKNGKYYISILVDCEVSKQRTGNGEIGIDLGIKDFAVLSDGTRIDNPKHLRERMKRLKGLQKSLSRKQKGSNRREVTKQKLAIQHEKVANQRKDFLHKLSTKLVLENQYIALEDLNIKGMMKNHKLAGAIAEVSWGEFVRQLEYKANWYSSQVVKIGRFEPSSKMCGCGSINTSLTLADRTWVCSECGANNDRDLLAAQNILKFSRGNHGVADEEER